MLNTIAVPVVSVYFVSVTLELFVQADMRQVRSFNCKQTIWG